MSPTVSFSKSSSMNRLPSISGASAFGAAGGSVVVDLVDDDVHAFADLGFQLGLGNGLCLFHKAVPAVLLYLGVT